MALVLDSNIMTMLEVRLVRQGVGGRGQGAGGREQGAGSRGQGAGSRGIRN